MCEILEHLDLERIGNAAPKWYMGYSDNTNFTFLLPTLWDTAVHLRSLRGGLRDGAMACFDSGCYDLLRGRKLSFRGYPLWEKESLKK